METRFTLTIWTRNGARQSTFVDLLDAYDRIAIDMAYGAQMAQIRNETTGAIVHARYAAPIESRSSLESAERAWARKGGE